MLISAVVSTVAVTGMHAAGNASAMEPDNPLAGLRAEHPRLLLTPELLGRVKAELATGGALKRWYDAVKANADRMLDAPVSIWELRDGVRLLFVSREVLDRVQTLGLAWLIDRDARHRQRLWQELEGVCGFKNWNPDHFLDTAEMTAAVALGLDWLYDDWSANQRETLASGIRRLGLAPGLAAYEGKVWWATNAFNWNQVCNGGLLMGALAVAEVAPEESGTIVRNAVAGLPHALASYGRDGAWEEGPSYWHYATEYTVFALASLKSALGHDFGLSDRENLAKAWQFPLQLTGPSGRLFNFADSDASPWSGTPAMWWLADRYQTPIAARWQHGYANRRPRPLDAIWGTLAGPSKTAPPPTAMHFRDAGVVSMRTGWDASAGWVAIKAGRNGVNHGQLDLGSFVYENDGVRWFIDLGRDGYNLPGYFDAKPAGRRWHYYRNRAEGHNTIVINPGLGPDQRVDGVAAIDAFEPADDGGMVRVNLSATYPIEGARIHRTFTLRGGSLWIEDSILLGRPHEVWSFLHTQAQVELDEANEAATLRQGDKAIHLRVFGHASLKILPAAPMASSPKPERQAENAGITTIALHAPALDSGMLRFEIGPVP